MNDPVETIESSAFDAWPADEVEGLGGWRLRAMRGVTRRANSVWTLEAVGEATIEERIDAVEHWYVLRRLPPMFQISDRSRPAGLDAALERRGYGIEAPVSIQVAATKDVVSTGCERDVVVTRGLPDVWFEISARGGRFAEVADIYRGLLLRIGSGARFALARVDGQAAAVGLGVVGRGSMGIFRC